MRIKFLSFIASFFMVSFVITSCLDDDNDIEYSPDATIHAFELDTIGYGISSYIFHPQRYRVFVHQSYKQELNGIRFNVGLSGRSGQLYERKQLERQLHINRYVKGLIT